MNCEEIIITTTTKTISIMDGDDENENDQKVNGYHDPTTSQTASHL